jgi:transposase
VSRSRTIDLRWNALLNDFRRSGLTQAEFCRRRQISLHSFRKHLYRPLPSTPAPNDDRSSFGADHHFLPVTILHDPIPPITVSQPHLELILSNGRRIAVAPGFDPQTLRRLITVVEERPCLD